MEFRGNTRILIQLAFFRTFDSCTILENSIYYDEFLVHLGRFHRLTWPSSFSGHRFKLESEDFIFHILQRNFSNFSIKILVRLKGSLNGYIFFFFCSQLAYMFKLIKTTGSFSKPSIFFRGLFITGKSYHNLSIKRKNYKLD